MIEVIEQGTGPEDRPTYKRKCPECNCVFTYQWTDVIENGWSGGYKCVPCPTCNYPVAHILNGGPINHPLIEDL